MRFRGSGRPLSEEGLDRVCDTLGVEKPEVWAVMTVETRGFGFLADRRPQILFERHIFSRRTGGRFDAGHPDISDSGSGGYSGGAKEYPRLARAMRLDRTAALESVSWGIGQVMGFNHATAGYATVGDMVKAMVRDEDAQLLAMANFIRGNNLAGALQRCDWAAFARGYNGPAYAKNEYDTRLAAAHAKCAVSVPDLGLRTAQSALLYLGIDPGGIDGVHGRRTRSALTLFQERAGLPKTGELDAETRSRLLAQAFPA